MKLKLQLVVLATSLVAAFGFFSTARAASISDIGDVFKNGIVSCGKTNTPDGSRPSDTCTIEDIFIVAARFTNFLLAFSGAFVVYRLVDAGFGMVTANGNPQGIQEAKDKVANAFWGLLLIFVAFLVVQLVLYTLLQLQGPTDVINNPTNFIKSGK